MSKIIITIKRLIFDLLIDTIFPKDESRKNTEELISKIAKIKRDERDRNLKYPCPAYSFYNYKNPLVKDMIWQLKYRNKTDIANFFADKIYDQLCEELTDLELIFDFTKPLLIPIPISKNKSRTRGFNQSVAICRALENIDNNNFFTYTPNVLYKIKDTISQSHLKDKYKRLINLKDSFSVKDSSSQKSAISNKNIILLDDVLTTGSTLTEATKTLKNAGAKQIIWVVIAH